MFLRDKKAIEVDVEKTTLRYDGFAFETDLRCARKDNLLYGEGKNCAVKNFALEHGVGLKAFTQNGNEQFVLGGENAPYQFFCVWEKDAAGAYASTLAYIAKNGDFYISREGGAYWEHIRNFGAPMHAFTAFGDKGELKTALVGAAGMYLYSKEEGLLSSVLDKTTGAGCSFMGRVFCGVEPRTLAFSAPFAPLDFSDSLDGGGSIVLPNDKGEILALVPLEDRIYVFQELGICALEPAGAARAFVFENIEYQGGRIYKGSVGACASDGARVFFLAEDGAYAFDGKRVKRTCENLEVLPKRGGQVCVHAVVEGKYFLTFLDEKEEQKHLILDGKSGEGYYAFAISAPSFYQGGALGVLGTRVYWLREGGKLLENEAASFTVRGAEFGKRGVKCLEGLTVYGCGKAKITVGNGGKSKTFSVELGDGVATVKPWLRGRRFSLKIELAAGARITGLLAQTATLSGLK